MSKRSGRRTALGAHPPSGKHTGFGGLPSVGKYTKQPVETSDRFVSWRLSRLDFGGPWCWTRMDPGKQTEVYGKLATYESRRWTEFEGVGGNKNIPAAHLCKEAQNRLAAIDADDADGSLYELRLSGVERVWGIRQGDIIYLLWWDHSHEVCPSKR